MKSKLLKHVFPPKKSPYYQKLEATNNEMNQEIAHIKPPKCSNLWKRELKAPEGLQEGDDIVIINAYKVGAVIVTMGVPIT